MERKTMIVTAADVKDGRYCGSTDLASFDGNLEIEANLGTVLFDRLCVSGFISAKAGCGIEAGEGIKAGWGIEAGLGIEAGWGIEAGLSITCKTVLSAGLRIFAGLCLWRLPTDDERQISCKRLDKGTVCFGELTETDPAKKASV